MTKFVVLVVKPSKNTQTQRCNNIKNVKVFQQKRLIFGEDTKNLKNASIDALGRFSVNHAAADSLYKHFKSSKHASSSFPLARLHLSLYNTILCLLRSTQVSRYYRSQYDDDFKNCIIFTKSIHL